MPVVTINEAADRLALVVVGAKPATLAEIYAELFPEKPISEVPSAAKIEQLIRAGLEAEEIVDLWNVAFPADHNVWYDEEDEKIHYNEEAPG